MYIRFADSNNNYSPYYRVNPDQESVELLSSTLDIDVIIPYGYDDTMPMRDRDSEFKGLFCGDIFINEDDPSIINKLDSAEIDEYGIIPYVFCYTGPVTNYATGTMVYIYTDEDHPIYITPGKDFKVALVFNAGIANPEPGPGGDPEDPDQPDEPEPLFSGEDLYVTKGLKLINKTTTDIINIIESIIDRFVGEFDSTVYFTLNNYQTFYEEPTTEITSLFKAGSTRDAGNAADYGKYVIKDSSGHITEIVNNIPLKATSTSVDFKINDQSYLKNKLTVDSPFTIVPNNVSQLAGYDPDPSPQLIPLIFIIKEYPDFSAGRYWPESVETISFQFY